MGCSNKLPTPTPTVLDETVGAEQSMDFGMDFGTCSQSMSRERYLALVVVSGDDSEPEMLCYTYMYTMYMTIRYTTFPPPKRQHFTKCMGLGRFVN